MSVLCDKFENCLLSYLSMSHYVCCFVFNVEKNFQGGNRGSLVSMGKPTSSTLASLAGLFRERDDRAISQAPDAQARADERLGDINDTEREFVSSRVRVSLIYRFKASINDFFFRLLTQI